MEIELVDQREVRDSVRYEHEVERLTECALADVVRTDEQRVTVELEVHRFHAAEVSDIKLDDLYGPSAPHFACIATRTATILNVRFKQVRVRSARRGDGRRFLYPSGSVFSVQMNGIHLFSQLIRHPSDSDILSHSTREVDVASRRQFLH